MKKLSANRKMSRQYSQLLLQPKNSTKGSTNPKEEIVLNLEDEVQKYLKKIDHFKSCNRKKKKNFLKNSKGEKREELGEYYIRLLKSRDNLCLNLFTSNILLREFEV